MAVPHQTYVNAVVGAGIFQGREKFADDSACFCKFVAIGRSFGQNGEQIEQFFIGFIRFDFPFVAVGHHTEIGSEQRQIVYEAFYRFIDFRDIYSVINARGAVSVNGKRLFLFKRHGTEKGVRSIGIHRDFRGLFYPA